MRLSIVIPTKNEEAYLPRLLDSIDKQTLKERETIVADAGSMDRTREIARQHEARIVEGGMPGPGRNRGALQSQGDMILFLDADVLLPNETYLEDCVREMDERNLDVATSPPLAWDGTTLDHVMHEAYNVYARATEHILPHAGGFCIFVRRSTHEALKGFDEQVVFAEDHDYVRRAKKMGKEFGILRCHKLPVSVRRLQKEGRANIALKYIYSEFRLVTRGSFRHMPFKYEFGQFTKPDETHRP
jgi:glycosyltransferase involved in cell wall biosynthesis